eukprot:gnl/Hemi2/14452_TR4899_c0_g2_i1.p1 gnl/Hemi2/14452_TR4899_c0_g2~~gnl/Hemi2/14452_TR4899_c0_g2_i1.p1  ORF type:complete len:178 (+),score=18.47 gnl/Hemi2/14452_TR4899_c0_g2_i1:312-845(+)
MESIKGMLGIAPPPPPEEKGWFSDVQQQVDDACTLTWSQRLWGFGICFLCGIGCTLLSLLFLPTIVLRPAKFAFLFSLGNVLSLGSTAFLIGPWRQVQSMFDPVRVVATIVYLGAMGGTIFACIQYPNFLLVLILIIVEWIALIWYALSYIPYGRDMCWWMCCNGGVNPATAVSYVV